MLFDNPLGRAVVLVAVLFCSVAPAASVPEQGPVAWWKFDEGSGKVAADSATSQKDKIVSPQKVDRSAAYAARYVAKNIVAAGLADRCEIQVSYAIGVAEPTSIMVETFGTEKVPSEQLTLLVREFFDLRPYGLIQMLDLLHPIYKETAAYGHFGREHFPWEKTDKAQLLRDAAGLK